MEFLVEFEVDVPPDVTADEVESRTRAEAAAAAQLAEEGRLLRLWRRDAVEDDTTMIGLYTAADERELTDVLSALPLADWMQVTIIPLAAHLNDPGPTAGERAHG